MKQTISKLALTLGLILMFGANAWAGTKDYKVTCTVEGYEGSYKPGTTIEGKKIGYTIKQEYSSGLIGIGAQEGVSTDADAETLTMQKYNKTPTVLYTNNVTDFITARTISGFDASITVDGTLITIAYTKDFSTTYTVSCLKSNGNSQTMGNNYGYTIKKAYPANDEGISTAANEKTLIIKNKNQEPTVLTTENILDYITLRSGGGQAKVTVDGTKITIQYGTETSVNYNVVCTLNGNSQTMNGTYGYTILKAYPANNEGVSTGADASPLTLKKWGSNITTLSTSNIGDYITPRSVDETGATVTVTSRTSHGSTTRTITIAYTGLIEYTVVFANTPAGYGYTLEQGTESGTNKFKVAATITQSNYRDYITVNNPAGYESTVTVSGTTITVSYSKTNVTEFIIGDLKYKVLTDPSGETNGTVSVRLNNMKAENVTIPATVTYDECTYDVTEIPGFGFTKYYSDNSTGQSTQASDMAKAYNRQSPYDDLDEGIDALTMYLDGDYAAHLWCSNPNSREYKRLNDGTYELDARETVEGHGGNSNHNERYSTYFHGFNPYLKTVTFEEGSKITKIGNDAFCGCWNLEGIQIPYSVESIGTCAFGGCISLAKFEIGVNGTNKCNPKLQVLEDSLLIHCESLTSLRIPEGITTIGQRTTQYLLRLSKIELPSTLTTIKGEFMCTALSLTSISIPASVTIIGGSAFHGCEALSDVYLLGPPSSLKMNGEYSNVKTFGSNNAYCAKALNNCTFHVLPQYLYSKEEIAAGYRSKKPTDEGYKEAYNGTYSSDILNSWGTVDGDNSETAAADGNYFTSTFPEVKKTYVPGQWVTFCMPESEIFFEITDADGKLANQSFVDLNEETKAKVQKEQSSEIDPTPGEQEEYSVKERPAATTDAASGFLKYNFEYGWDKYDGFGPGCEVAIMTDAWEDAIDPNLYHARFDLINIDQIQPNTPYLICPMLEEGASQADLNICLWTDEDMRRKEFVDNMGAYPHTITKHTEGTHKDSKLNPGHKKPAYVNMIGQIDRGLTNALQPYDIYFKSAGPGWVTDSKRHIGDFKMVPEGGTTYLHSCSAYWNVVVEEGKLNSGGYVSQVKLGSVAEFDAVPADPTAINEIQNDKPARIVVDGIYDMNGRKLDVDQSQLPQGMYIVNGKKVLNK